MRKLLLSLVPVFALCWSVPAIAAAPVYEFAYDGPFIIQAKLLSGHLEGYFSGEDSDGDGIVELQELESFGWEGVDYLRNGVPVCGPDCTLSAFQYAGGTHGVYFHSEWYLPDGSHEITEASHSIRGSYGRYDYWTMAWTANTQFSIRLQTPAIPEPSTALMSLAGLALLATFGGRGNRNNRVARG